MRHTRCRQVDPLALPFRLRIQSPCARQPRGTHLLRPPERRRIMAAAAAAVSEERPEDIAAAEAERRIEKALDCPCVDDLKSGSCGPDFKAGACGVLPCRVELLTTHSPLTPPTPTTQRSAASCAARRQIRAQTAPTRFLHCRRAHGASPPGLCQLLHSHRNLFPPAGVLDKTCR